MDREDTPEAADALARALFGPGTFVDPDGPGFAVVRYRRELNEAVRPAGAVTRTVLGRGATRREALEDARRRSPPRARAPGGLPSPARRC